MAPFWLSDAGLRSPPETNALGTLPQQIVFGGDENFPPYEYINQQGQPEGFNIDLIRAIARERGIAVQIKLRPWRQTLKQLENGKVDVAAMYRSSQRSRAYDFAIPHELIYHEMFIRKGSPPIRSLADLAGKRILLQVGTYAVDALTELGLGGKFIQVNSEPEALSKLALGEGDVAFVTQTVGRPFARGALAAEVSATGPPVLLSEYAFVTRKDQMALIETLNEGIMAVRASGEYDRLYNKWLRPDRSAQLVRKIAWGLAATVMAVILVVGWNQSLRRRVAQQTQLLRAEFEARERTKAALAESDRTVRVLFEQAGVGVAQIESRTGHFLRVNQRYCDLLGYTPQEMLAIRFQDISHPEEIALDQANIERLIGGEIREFTMEKRYRRKDGTIIWVSLTVSPLWTGKKDPLHHVAVVQDITERKRAEQEVRQLNAELEQRVHERTQQLEAANQELEAFSYSVSHDLRAPLRAIDGWAQVLMEDYGATLGPDGSQAIDRLRTAAQRMSVLIDDLLKLSHFSRQPLNCEKVVMYALVKSVWEEVCAAQPSHHAELQLGDLPDCQADPSLLTQVFINLLGNALKFSSRNPRPIIVVGSQKGPKGECVYFVKDNGAGFDMRDADKLFGAFQRLHSSQEFSGSGIGLSIAQRIISRHGGRIWAESTVGQGATFYFTLGTAAG